jgi:hypothetical protein
MVEAVADNPHGPIALTVGHEALVVGSPLPMGLSVQALTNALQVGRSIEKLVICLGSDDTLEFRRKFQFGPIMDFEFLEGSDESPRTLLATAVRDNCYLKHLEILPGSCDISITAVLKAIRRNGSLCTVVCNDFFNCDRMGRVRMYCTRNRHVHELLAKLTRDSEEDSMESNALLPMIPRVFAVVQQARRMAGSRMIQACLALSQVIGPKADKKRASHN